MGRILIQVSGRLPERALDRIAGVRLLTVLRASVHDQAALYGLLRLLPDLGLDLIGLRQIGGVWSSPAPGEADEPPGHANPFMIEVVLEGPVGDLAVSTLAEHVEVTHLATRLALHDRQDVSEVLKYARSVGAEVEFTTDLPP